MTQRGDRWGYANARTWLVEGVRRRLGLDRPPRPLEAFSVDRDTARADLPAPESRLAKLFFEKEGRTVDKWMSYLLAYDRHLSRYCGTSFAMLEIGVFRGGSLELWREYFGPQATLFGVDIDPQCAGRVSAPNEVRIGSQADPAFLLDVVREMGALDVVLDDGSHVAEHQWATFETLFPHLPVGGLYIIEDLHTSYWRWNWNGGYRRPGTGVELVKDLIDDMHGWFHGRPMITVAGRDVRAIHLYDSVVIIEKGAGEPPRRVRSGPEADALRRASAEPVQPVRRPVDA